MKRSKRNARIQHQFLAIGAMVVGGLCSPAFARDERPLPEPLACPVDVPVRVASADTLRRFTALDGCSPDAVVVAALPDPGPAARPFDGAPVSIDGARHYQAQRVRKGRIGDTTVQTAAVGAAGTRVVRIIPILPKEEEAPAAIAPAPTALAAEEPATTPVGFVAPSESAILAMRPASFTTPYDSLITRAAARHRVDPLMLHSVIKQESAYRPGAVSRVGARGLMQIMPGTGSDLGVANASYLLDPATNIDAGARLLKKLWGRLDGRFDLVLAAYNAGEGAVRKYGMQVPPYAETRNYVSKVQASYYDLVAGR